jgi:hypothetical protein
MLTPGSCVVLAAPGHHSGTPRTPEESDMMPVRADLDLRLVLGGDRMVTVPATLAYSPDEPYAVTALFRTSDGDVTWVFGRDLLEDGMTESVGEGDVAVWPSATGGAHVICLSLASPSGSALLEADLVAVRSFLDASYQLVPLGAEADQLDIDAELAVLLGDGSSPTA